ncbi:MAG: RNA ligase RtcB family protein [Lentisphaeria bacterium]|nr:RNA ligase RtcB family protein [Lentisphaeria bacterium]
MDKISNIYCGKKTWLEGPAVEQFKHVMTFPGIIRGAAFPDLHPGRGVPVGAAFLSEKIIYPSLIGNDIGCGMTLFATGIKEHKFKKDKLFRRLGREPEEPLQTSAKKLLDFENEPVSDPENMLGTLGHGNHFAEFLAVEKIINVEKCEALNIRKNDILLLIHSGSRCYGEFLWREIAAEHGDNGLLYDSPDGADYLAKHAELIRWASFNRRLIGKTLGFMAACEVTELLNATHNSITPFGKNCFIHRKGASNTENGEPVVVAGSRGTYSYLVLPQGNGIENIHSIAHGAGRKWNRQSTRDRIRAKHDDVQNLLKTKLGSAVICPDKNLLYEEAPEAYKDISTVIADLQNFNLASAAAVLRPVVNIKP